MMNAEPWLRSSATRPESETLSMKTCQACGHRPAVVEFIQVTGDVRRELSLCRECALSMGVRAQVEAFQRLSQLLLHDLPLTDIPEEMKAALGSKCSNCGLVFQEFIQTGLLGCPKCYEDFQDLLKPILRRMHGVTKKPTASQTSTGKSGGMDYESAETKEQLEMELHLALLEEDYEKAATLRDKLKKLPPASRREGPTDSTRN
jgi:protein arginine kinase activator